MLSVSRKIAFVALAALALVATGCNANAKKIVGKWKMLSMTHKDGKEQKFDVMGMSALMEFTPDGHIKVGLDLSGLPPELKEKLDGDKEAAAKLQETKQIGRYKVSGSTIEFQDVDKDKESPFGKNNRGRLAFDGDNLTISGDDGSVKLTRVK